MLEFLNKKIILVVFGFLFILSLNILPAEASKDIDIEIKSSVDRERLNLGESLIFKVEIVGNFDSQPKVKLPSLDNFEIIAQTQSEQILFKDRKRFRKFILAYSLRPKKEGRFNIGEVRLIFKGRIFKTKPIEIEI